MSDDHLNDELKKRIGAVFNDYHDDTAGEGWLRLREKYPEKDEDRPVAWLWRMAGVAALLLAFLSIGLWLNFHQTGKGNMIAKNKSIKSNSPVTANSYKSQSVHVPGGGANTAYQPVHKTPNTSAIKPAATYASSVMKHPDRYLTKGRNPINRLVDSNAARLSAYNTVSKAKLPVIQQSPPTSLHNLVPDKAIATANTPSITNNTVNPPAITVITNGNTPAKQATATVQSAEQNKNAAPVKMDKSIQSLFDNDKYRSAQNNTEPKIKQKTIVLAVYAATYVNYAKGSNKQVNTGGGLTVDFRLTDNLSLTTGIGIAQNTLAYNSNTSQVNVFPVAVSYSYNNVASSAFSELSPSSQALNASLVNLDVPVNLKYVFNPQKKNVYVAAGLSSGTFINESYKYTYNYATPNSTNVTQSQQDNNNKTFDNFYFAKMFNLSFGIGYPLGKNQLIIEPFLKYPINGLGEQHILFGSGGLNLKINFDPPKKSN